MSLPARLTLGSLVAVMFFNVSGGPIGLEGLIGAVGPGAALVLLTATPLIYSVPEALLVGELASMLPAEGGYYVWVRRAFGNTWGFVNGWLSWAYSLVDMALYPVLFLQYLAFLVPDLDKLSGFGIALTVIWTATWLNLRGARIVGSSSIGFGVLVVAPFLVLSILALVRWLTTSPVAPFPVEPLHRPGETFVFALGLGISQSIWNYSGWDNASTVGGEITDSGRTYPRALVRALPLVSLVYLGSVIPVLAVTDWRLWTDGSWPKLAEQVGGRWLAFAIAAAGMLSALGLFNGLLLAYSRIPLAMARDGLLPRWLGVTDERGTPRRAVIVSAIAYSLFALVPFGELLSADVMFYTAALALEFAALLHFRRHEPELRGSFRVPVGRFALAAIAALPIALIVLSIVLQLFGEEDALRALIATALFGLLGPAVYAIVRLRAKARLAS